jgi:serine/threonine protein phosphatase PrpC
MPAEQYLANGRVASYHDNSCHGDDAFVTRALDHCRALDAVLDGTTGRGGKYASRYVADSLREAAIERLDDVLSLLEMTNRALFQRGKGSFLLTTLSVALKLGDDLHVVSAGDSPVFLVRDGAMVVLTRAAEGLTPRGMTKVLGCSQKLFYSARQIALRAWDRLVLATDGITDNIAPAELASLVQEAPSPEAAVATLHNLLDEKRRGNRGRIDDHSGFLKDDTTAIIRYIGSSDDQDAPERLNHLRLRC